MTVKDVDGYRRSRKGEEIFRFVWEWDGIPRWCSTSEWRSEACMLADAPHFATAAFVETILLP